MSAISAIKLEVARTTILHRRTAFAIAGVVFGVIISLLVSEAMFRVLEHRENSRNTYEGKGGHWFADGRWGWKPSKGEFHGTTEEFDITGHINSFYMNDAEVDSAADASRTRIFALGDSHTYAVGVSTEQAWPKVLERKLNSAYAQGKFRVYNGGVSGFNMHQYLLRLMDQGPVLRPRFVVLGLSYATDLYDLLPPERGGWIYGDSGWPRDYFDFDESGHLVERRWQGQKMVGPAKLNLARTIRDILNHTAIFRYLRRSKLALEIGSRVRIGGQSLWPNMEIVVEKQPSQQHEYQWRLFEALLLRINDESRRQGATLVVVGIPYLPQVYDDLWYNTFGMNAQYSRVTAPRRIKWFCKQNGIQYVETLDDFQNKYRATGQWLHYRKDAHPTPQGHELIADAILRSVALNIAK